MVVLNIWDIFSRAEVYVFATEELTHLPSLVLLDRGDQPSGPGCSRPRLATDPSDSSNTAEGPPAGPQAAVGSPLLDGEDMVSSAAQALPQLTVASPRQDGSPLSVTGPSPAGPDPLLTECSDTDCNTVLNARAPSTRMQYLHLYGFLYGVPTGVRTPCTVWFKFNLWCSQQQNNRNDNSNYSYNLKNKQSTIENNNK